MRSGALSRGFLETHNLATSYPEQYNDEIRYIDCNVLQRTATDLRLQMSTSLKGQKRFSYRGAKVWNNLASEVKQGPSLSLFKQTLLIDNNSN